MYEPDVHVSLDGLANGGAARDSVRSDISVGGRAGAAVDDHPLSGARWRQQGQSESSMHRGSMRGSKGTGRPPLEQIDRMGQAVECAIAATRGARWTGVIKSADGPIVKGAPGSGRQRN